MSTFTETFRQAIEEVRMEMITDKEKSIKDLIEERMVLALNSRSVSEARLDGIQTHYAVCQRVLGDIRQAYLVGHGDVLLIQSMFEALRIQIDAIDNSLLEAFHE